MCLILAACCFWCLDAWGQNVELRAYTDKARYIPEELANITVELENKGPGNWGGTILVEISRLGGPPITLSEPTGTVPAGTTFSQDFPWPTPPADFEGYFVGVSTNPSTQTAVTAIDVSSHWTRYPRYGYLTEFFTNSLTTLGKMPQDMVPPLARDFHLNSLQFYDWMYRHEEAVKYTAPGGSVVAANWVDWRCNSISTAALSLLIDLAHERGMAAMPYFAAYLVQNDLVTGGYVLPATPATLTTAGVSAADYNSWRLFAGGALKHYACGYPCTLGPPCSCFCRPFFSIMNPLNVNWQDHLIGQFDNTLLSLGFDGIHIDQLGDVAPGATYTSSSGPVDLQHGFSPLINRAKKHLKELTQAHPNKICGDEVITFNLVDGAIGGWAYEDIVLDSQVDFIYSEMWGGEFYFNLYDLICDARYRTGGKPVVLAAYLNRNEGPCPISAPCNFDQHSVRLADASIFASGGFHIELGDGGRMLGNEYFPNTDRVMDNALYDVMKDYYTFITAYEKILFDPDLTYADRGLQWINIWDDPALSNPVPISGDAQAGTVWYLLRRNAQYEVLNLINLRGNDGKWRNFAGPPSPQKGLHVRLRMGPQAAVKRVFLATPDKDHGKTTELDFSTGVDPLGTHQGSYVEFPKATSPGFDLTYWDTIYIERDVTPPPGDVYEAETAVRSDVLVGAATPAGFTGTGFVGGFDGCCPHSYPGLGSLLVEGVSFYITCPRDNDYLLNVRYSNPGTNAQRHVHIDGNGINSSATLGFPNKTSWDTVGFPAFLTAGPHQVTIMWISDFGTNLLIDSLSLGSLVNGLTGDYYRTKDLTHLELSRVDPGVNFLWTGAPHSGTMAIDRFSVRWSGLVKSQAAGNYNFYVKSDDGSRLWIDGRILIDKWASPTFVEESATINLAASTFYSIRLEFYDESGNAEARLSWDGPGISKQIIPSASLFVSGYVAPTAPPPPSFKRGDANADGLLELSDALMIAQTAAGKLPQCEAASDVDDNGIVDLFDAIALLGHLFLGCAPPYSPFPSCGIDPTPDPLTCNVSSCP